MQFQKLVSTTILSFETHPIPLHKLRSHVMTLGAFSPVHEGPQKPALDNHFKDLQAANTVSEIFWVLRDNISFFNYHILEHIITVLGTEKDNENLQWYKEQFEKYAKRRIYECLPEFGPVSENGYVDVFVKVDSQYERYTVAEAEIFRCQLSKILNISHQGVLRLCRVEKGCFQLTFQVPTFVQQAIFPLSSQQERALEEKGVIRLMCGEYQFIRKVLICCSSHFSFIVYSSINTSIVVGRFVDWGGGGVDRGMWAKQAVCIKVSKGACPPGKFFKWDAQKSLLWLILGQNLFCQSYFFASKILTGHTNLLQILHNVVHTAAMRSWSFWSKKVCNSEIASIYFFPSGNLMFYMSHAVLVHSYRCCYKLLHNINSFLYLSQPAIFKE